MASCVDCNYENDPSGQGYCYMFREKPDIVDKWGCCAQHQDVPKLPHDAAMALIPMFVEEVKNRDS